MSQALNLRENENGKIVFDYVNSKGQTKTTSLPKSATIDNVKYDITKMENIEQLQAYADLTAQKYVQQGIDGKANWDAKSEDEKNNITEKSKVAAEAREAAMTPEQKAERAATAKATAIAREASLTDEQKEARKEQGKAAYEALTPEQKEAHKQSSIEAAKANVASADALGFSL